MARRSKAEIALEKVINAIIEKHIQGKRFNVFDLGKISKAAKDAAASGTDIDKAVLEACEKYEIVVT